MGVLIDKIVNLGFKKHIVISLVIRCILITYGVYHDNHSTVKYTDVDYKVFTDASKHVLNNQSPYNRHTYRYSPLVAISLTPNLLVHHCFGKILFSLIDVLVGLLIRLIVKSNMNNYYSHIKNVEVDIAVQKKIKLKNRHNQHKSDHTIERNADISMLAWLYNPMTIAIATRGNCDSMAGFFVLLSLYFLQCKKMSFVAGIVHGFSIHFRLYPIIYSLTMYMYLSKFSVYSIEDRQLNKHEDRQLNKHEDRQLNKSQSSKITNENSAIDHKISDSLVLHYDSPEKKTIFKMKYLLYLVPNWEQIKLVIGCLLALCSLTMLFYYMYGYQFLHETYLYHFIRKDTRHNFSLYFYLLYLTAWVKNVGMWQNVLIVLPQLLLLVVFSFRYGLNKFSLNFGVLVQTIVFVIYNTVLTSQYFVWIMAILPLCIWQIRIPAKSALLLLVVWFVAQGAWLLPAYYLEFQGQNTFILVWIQSVSLFCAHIAILGRMIMYFMPLEKSKSE